MEKTKAERKAELMKVLSGLELHTARIGTTLYIYTEESRDDTVAKIMARARKTGEAAYFRHATVWFDKVAIVDTTKSGSDQYVWDKTGNRVKHEVIQFVKDGDGNIEQRVVGEVFADLD